jgi:hypothetical protein
VSQRFPALPRTHRPGVNLLPCCLFCPLACRRGGVALGSTSWSCLALVWPASCCPSLCRHCQDVDGCCLCGADLFDNSGCKRDSCVFIVRRHPPPLFSAPRAQRPRSAVGGTWDADVSCRVNVRVCGVHVSQYEHKVVKGAAGVSACLRRTDELQYPTVPTSVAWITLCVLAIACCLTLMWYRVGGRVQCRRDVCHAARCPHAPVCRVDRA